MSLATLSPATPHTGPGVQSAHSKVTSVTPANPATSSFEQLGLAIRRVNRAAEQRQNAYAELAAQVELGEARRALADQLVSMSRQQLREELADQLTEMLNALLDCGAYDRQVTHEEVAQAESAIAGSWQGLVAAMVLVPAWALNSTPLLSDIPKPFWGAYARWVFAAPARFCTQSDRAKFASHLAGHLEELNRWQSRNPAAGAVAAAVNGYMRAGALLPALFALESGARQIELRGTILARARKNRVPFTPNLRSRDGRRLRVGFVNTDFGPTLETYRALAVFEELDPHAFEVSLFAVRQSDSPEFQHCRQRAESVALLPNGLDAQLEMLRKAELDVVVFNAAIPYESPEITQIAFHRVAPLQVLNHRRRFAGGFPEIDLYLSADEGTRCDEPYLTRIGVLRGPAHGFSFGNIAIPDTGLTRAGAGLPEDATVFVGVAQTGKVSAETIEAWARTLAAVENSRLLIALVQDSTGHAAKAERFGALVDEVMAAHGLDQARVAIFPCNEDPAHLHAAYSLSNLLLDHLEGANPRWVAEALRAGLPVITVEQSASHDLNASAFMLKAVGAGEWVASDPSQFVEKAVALSTDKLVREQTVERIRRAMEAGPECFDSLATSDAFGALIETAFDELVALGSEAFRHEKEPLQCFRSETVSDEINAALGALQLGDISSAAFESQLALRAVPGDAHARYLRGSVLLADGNPGRAVKYLLAAVQELGSDPEVWFVLAKGLRASQQVAQAIQALETCLRLAPKHLEALLLLHEVATGLGAADIAADTLLCMREIAPEDFRVTSLS